MGNYKFTPESILEFHCPGIGTSSVQETAVGYFKTYLNLVGISVDSEGFLDSDSFMVRYGANSTAQSNLNAQYSSQYTQLNSSNTKLNLYRGYLYNNISSITFLGYVTLPFKVSGSNIRIALPGTLIHLRNNNMSNVQQAAGSGTITRTSSSIAITGPSGNKTFAKSTFANSVVPLFVATCVQGGGGGGSSSEGLVAGRGGGGGGFACGVISFVKNSTCSFTIGSGGSGGYHDTGNSGTSSNHDGKNGSATSVVQNGTTVLYGGYGNGAMAGGSAPHSPSGGYTCATPYYLYKRADTNTAFKGCDGGHGSIDSTNEADGIFMYEVQLTKGARPFSEDYLFFNGTHGPGKSYNPGGAGGGASFLANGAAGGNAAGTGSNGTAGYGNGGGGGGYLITQYIKGGAGGTGSVRFFA